MPFAGHPTVGAAVGLARLPAARPAQSFVLEEKIGPVSCTAQVYDADSGRAEFLPRLPSDAGKVPETAAMAHALGAGESDIGGDYRPARWSAGVAFTFVALRSRAALERQSPILRHLKPCSASMGRRFIHVAVSLKAFAAIANSSDFCCGGCTTTSPHEKKYRRQNHRTHSMEQDERWYGLQLFRLRQT